MPTPRNAHIDLQDSPFFKLAQQTRNTPANKGKRRLLDEDLPSSDEEDFNEPQPTTSSSHCPSYSLNAPPARPTRSKLNSRLPVAVESLIDLHNAVENAFRIHLSTSSALPPPLIMPFSESHRAGHSSLKTYKQGLHILRFDTLIDLDTLSKLVASASSKNLNPATLSKLKYLWNDDIGFIIATTRVKEYSIGMEVAIEEKKTAKGAIGVMRDFARAKDEWFRQTDRRREIVTERAKAWVNEQFETWMNSQLEDVTKTPKSHSNQLSSSITRSGLLTPPSTASKGKAKKEDSTPQSPSERKVYPGDFLRSVTNTPSKQLPQLPMKTRPKTPSDALKRMASYNNAEKLMQTAPVKRARVKSPSPPPRSLKKAKTMMAEEDESNVNDVFRTPSKEAPATPTKAPSTMTMAERKKNLEASVRAKMELKRKAKEEQLGGGSEFNKQSHAVKSEVFQRRSRLSRLPAVAEAVYLLFAPNVSNVPSSPSASLPTPTSRKRRARPLQEVATVIVKSSKVAMSAAEACDSLKMLCNLCPDFVFLKLVDRVEYLEMPTSLSGLSGSAGHAIVPPSPSAHPLLAATTPNNASSGTTHPPKSPKSPKSPLTGTEVDSPSKRKSAMTLHAGADASIITPKMNQKPAINTPPENSDDWANDVQNALGVAGDTGGENGAEGVESTTNTTANLSNPITNADKEQNEHKQSSTPDLSTKMPGGYASAGTAGAGASAASLKDAPGQAKDAAARAYDTASQKVDAYADHIAKSANDQEASNLHEVAEKLKQDDHDPSIPVKDLANDTQPGVLGEYSEKAAAAVAGLTGASVGAGTGVAAGLAANESTKASRAQDEHTKFSTLSNPMEFPSGTFPTLEKLQTEPSTIPHIEGVTAARVENTFNEKKTEEKKQQESNKATEALAGVTAGVGGAGAASAVVANKYAQRKSADGAKSTKSEQANTIATDKTAHNVSPPSSSANLVKNTEENARESAQENEKANAQENSHDSSQVSSQKSSKVTPKRSFSQRIKGDVKILFGKLSKNDSKLELGMRLSLCRWARPLSANARHDKLLKLANKYLDERLSLVEKSSDLDNKTLAVRSRRLKELDTLPDLYSSYQQSMDTLHTTEKMASDEPDDILREMAAAEMEECSAVLQSNYNSLTEAILASNAHSQLSPKGILLELKAGVGGSESALFVQDMLKMYTAFSDSQRWSSSLLSTTYVNNEVSGAIKEAILEIKGTDTWPLLRFEKGVHRVQRVPLTETQGRVHTSTIGVLVMPVVDKMAEKALYDEKDVRLEVMRARGAGGQHVNKTESAVRLTHIPTGIQVSMQDTRSQQQNRQRAYQVLSSRLLSKRMQDEIDERKKGRISQIGNMDRSDKIRTYNYPQSRITDHRVNLSLSDLQSFFESGVGLSWFVDHLKAAEQDALLDSLLADA
ncbi:hypothetical protein E3P86_03059 [Wallemia ichthyophaga]|uniref:Prokaryotic-type class I peptide chain release factors domain-containing protein n=1 Tax=Wallemia ichthyophaga TaxID=245174 RepID=A0A4T0IUH8_WALIC|nr:hypothetical protein E3P86_03059 [Wallemia ichthyophaga]